MLQEPRGGEQVVLARRPRADIEQYMRKGGQAVRNHEEERPVRKKRGGRQYVGRKFTIVQTARSNGLVVDKYLEYVLENIGKADVADLLPWFDKLPKELSIFNKKA